jgi:hypothetical protein
METHSLHPIMIMKLSLALLALVASSNAQYFSAGWSPGQKQPEPQSPEHPFDSTNTPVPIAEPVKTTPLSLLNLFDTTKLLTSGPSVSLFNRFGINITERIEASSLVHMWDERVPLITDDNYEDLVVNEVMTEQEEADRVWIIVMYVSYLIQFLFLTVLCSSVTSQKLEGISKVFDELFDSAFNVSQIAGDLPHVRWGRMDYFNITRVTTKWAVWQCAF